MVTVQHHPLSERSFKLFDPDAPPRVDQWERLDIDGLENPVTALKVDGLSLRLGLQVIGRVTRAVPAGPPSVLNLSK